MIEAVEDDDSIKVIFPRYSPEVGSFPKCGRRNSYSDTDFDSCTLLNHQQDGFICTCDLLPSQNNWILVSDKADTLSNS